MGDSTFPCLQVAHLATVFSRRMPDGDGNHENRECECHASDQKGQHETGTRQDRMRKQHLCYQYGQRFRIGRLSACVEDNHHERDVCAGSDDQGDHDG
jgi:hypothetical protein